MSQVNTAINQLDQVTQQNAAMVEETTAACLSLSENAVTLGDLTRRFRVSTPSQAGRVSGRTAAFEDAHRRISSFQREQQHRPAHFGFTPKDEGLSDSIMAEDRAVI
jgi:methyl-accepting chemotaxis protein